jgi:hypothetical protein
MPCASAIAVQWQSKEVEISGIGVLDLDPSVAWPASHTCSDRYDDGTPARWRADDGVVPRAVEQFVKFIVPELVFDWVAELVVLCIAIQARR